MKIPDDVSYIMDKVEKWNQKRIYYRKLIMKISINFASEYRIRHPFNYRIQLKGVQPILNLVLIT